MGRRVIISDQQTATSSPGGALPSAAQGAAFDAAERAVGEKPKRAARSKKRKPSSAGKHPPRGSMRSLPVHSVFPNDLPITGEEIHKVLAALGPDLAALFEE